MIKQLTPLNTYVVRIEKGDFLQETVENLAHQHQWTSAKISAGIGAIESTDLAYFDSKTKQYQRKLFPEAAELLSLEGNITIKEDKPFIHWHASLSNTEYNCFGGHLFNAKVAVTCELFINTYQETLQRIYCDAIGLALIDM